MLALQQTRLGNSARMRNGFNLLHQPLRIQRHALGLVVYDEASLQRETRAMLQAREDAGIQASPAALSDTAGGASSKIRVEPTSHDATGT